jgi:hypothetical protein
VDSRDEGAGTQTSCCPQWTIGYFSGVVLYLAPSI